MHATQPSVARPAPAGPLDACPGEIVRVLEIDETPVGVYDVLLQDGRTIPNVPTLLPVASYVFKDGKARHGGSGMLPIAQKGAQCVVMFIPGYLGHAQPFILGFYSPVQARGGSQRNYRKLSPGSLAFLTPYGNGVVLHNGGVVEMLAEPNCRRVMTPAGAETTDSRRSLIADQCRNYRLQTAAGELTMTELGDGKVGTRWRLREFSNFGNSAAMRKARSAAQNVAIGTMSGVLEGQDPESAAIGAAGEEALRQARNPVERYVEIHYGSIDNGDLYQERFVGSKSVELRCDGQGRFFVSADEETAESVGAGAIVIRAKADGAREVSANQMKYTATSEVVWMTQRFEIQAPLIELVGTVVIQRGGLPSARIGDLVLVGDSVGEIITGQINLIH